MSYEDELIIVIAKWIKANNELKEINKFLYENTELFEGKTELDYKNELYRFFAAKITRFAKDEHQLMDILPYKLKRRIIIERL